MRWLRTHAELLAAGVLAVVVIALAATAYAQDAPVLVEAEKDGVDVLTAALIALVTAVAGFFGREGVYRWHGRNGASGGGETALSVHEKECARRYERMDARMAKMEADIAYIRGLLVKYTGGEK